MTIPVERLWALLDPARAEERFDKWKASLSKPELEVSRVPTAGQFHQVQDPGLGVATNATNLPHEPLDQGERVRVSAPCGDFDATVERAQVSSDDGRVYVIREDNGRLLFVRRVLCTPVPTPDPAATPADPVPDLQPGDRVHVRNFYLDFEGTVESAIVEMDWAKVRGDDGKIYFAKHADCMPMPNVLLGGLDRTTAVELAKRLRAKCRKTSLYRDALTGRLLENQGDPRSRSRKYDAT